MNKINIEYRISRNNENCSTCSNMYILHLFDKIIYKCMLLGNSKLSVSSVRLINTCNYYKELRINNK